MTTNSITPHVRYACTGTTDYTYTFKIFATSELEVKRITEAGVSTTLVLTTDYTVADTLAGTGGTVTTVATYSDGYIQIRRSSTPSQETDFVDAGPLPASQLENAIDKAYLILQEQNMLLADGAIAVTWRGPWGTTTAYSVLDMVTDSGLWYSCAVAHTSGTFNTDLSAGHWRLFLEQPASHTVVSHSDTTATGAELETLTDNSMADALHRHSELSASDGTPDQALTVGAAGKVTLTSGTDIDEFSIDGTLSGNSDDAVPTEKAVKTYVDANAKFYDAYVKIIESQTKGTDGGTFTQDAWQVRSMNYELNDPGSIASVSSSQITLAAGTYQCAISCIANGVGANQARLYDTTGSALLVTGLSIPGAGAAKINGRFVLSVESALEVQHYCLTTNAGDGFGAALDVATEVYATAEFWREA